ncbi:MAG: nucleotidyltransferase domain-containing protein [Thermoflexales bacterium]|nr:nucleotidyltransferase domain-containing protein [Thermoflexales bacterium]
MKEETLAPVVRALYHGLGNRLVAVVLFGSRARGDASPESDWDLLVVARDLPQRPFQRHLFLKRLLPAEWRGRVAILARTPEEFEARLPALFLDIALDGIILYDPQDYMAKRLAELRRLIQEYGLRRVQRGRDLVWNWDRPPGPDWSVEWGAG